MLWFNPPPALFIRELGSVFWPRVQGGKKQCWNWRKDGVELRALLLPPREYNLCIRFPLLAFYSVSVCQEISVLKKGGKWRRQPEPGRAATLFCHSRLQCLQYQTRRINGCPTWEMESAHLRGGCSPAFLLELCQGVLAECVELGMSQLYPAPRNQL